MKKNRCGQQFLRLFLALLLPLASSMPMFAAEREIQLAALPANFANDVNNGLKAWNNGIPDWSNALPNSFRDPQTAQSVIQEAHQHILKNPDLAQTRGLPSTLWESIQPYGDIANVHLAKDFPKKWSLDSLRQPLVVHIQDVHNLSSAQINIAYLLRNLEAIGATRIAAEGSAGPFTTLDFWRHYPDQSSVIATAKMLLREGYLSGLEVAGLLSDKTKIFGVEDKTTYLKQVQVFRNTLSDIPHTFDWQDSFSAVLTRAQLRYWSPLLNDFYAHAQSYNAGKIKLTDWLSYLAGTLNIRQNYPNIAKFLTVSDQEKLINVKSIEVEQIRLMRLLINKVSKRDMVALVEDTLSYRMNKISHETYYHRLKIWFQRYGVPVSEDMALYMDYLENVASIDRAALFSEMQALENVRANHLIDREANPARAWQLYSIAQDFTLMRAAIQFRLTPQDFTDYLQARRAISRLDKRLTQFLIAGGEEQPQVPEMNLRVQWVIASAETFSQLSEQRNHIFWQKMVESIGYPGYESAVGGIPFSGVCVVLAGGYHTEGLEKLWQEKGVSYITIRPKMDHIETAFNSDPMENFRRTYLPVEELFAQQKVSIAPSQVLGSNWLEHLAGPLVAPTYGRTAFSGSKTLMDSAAKYLEKKYAVIVTPEETGNPQVQSLQIKLDKQNLRFVQIAKNAVPESLTQPLLSAVLARAGLSKLSPNAWVMDLRPDQDDSSRQNGIYILDTENTETLFDQGQNSAKSLASALVLFLRAWQYPTLSLLPQQTWQKLSADVLTESNRSGQLLEERKNAPSSNSLAQIAGAFHKRVRANLFASFFTGPVISVATTRVTDTVFFSPKEDSATDSPRTQERELASPPARMLIQSNHSEVPTFEAQLKAFLALPQNEEQRVKLAAKALKIASDSTNESITLEAKIKALAAYYGLNAMSQPAQAQVEKILQQLAGDAAELPKPSINFAESFSAALEITQDTEEESKDGSPRIPISGEGWEQGLFETTLAQVLYALQSVWNTDVSRAQAYRNLNANRVELFDITDIIDNTANAEKVTHQLQNALRSNNKNITLFVKSTDSDLTEDEVRAQLKRRKITIDALPIQILPQLNAQTYFIALKEKPEALLVFTADPTRWETTLENNPNILFLQILSDTEVRALYSVADILNSLQSLKEASRSA